MASVTQRIQSIQQPRGGYLPIKCFSKEVLDDGITLNAEENVHPSLIGRIFQSSFERGIYLPGLFYFKRHNQRNRGQCYLL